MGHHSLLQLLFPLVGIKFGLHNQILQEFYRPNLEKRKLLLVECFSHAWLPLIVIVVQNKLPLCQMVIPIDDWVRGIRIVRQNEEKLMPLDHGNSQNHGTWTTCDHHNNSFCGPYLLTIANKIDSLLF